MSKIQCKQTYIYTYIPTIVHIVTFKSLTHKSKHSDINNVYQKTVQCQLSYSEVHVDTHSAGRTPVEFFISLAALQFLAHILHLMQHSPLLGEKTWL